MVAASIMSENGRESGERGEGRSEARQESAPEVALGVGDERVVLIRPHVLGLDVLPGSLVRETASRPVDELQARAARRPSRERPDLAWKSGRKSSWNLTSAAAIFS